MYDEKGASIIEFTIVLGLLISVLSIGQLFLNFTNISFLTVEDNFSVRQDVRAIANFISNELRNATALHILNPGETIPSPSVIPSFDEHYIFLNDNGSPEYRSKRQSRLLSQGHSTGISFNLDFFVDNANPNLFTFTVTGMHDTGFVYSLRSNVFLKNLALNNKIITGSNSNRLRFIKTPSVLPTIIVSDPASVFTAQPFKRNINLTLYNDSFLRISKSEVLLSNDFQGLTVISYNVISDTQAVVTLSGNLQRNYGSGRITIPGNGLAGGLPKSASVLVEVPISYMLATPNPIPAGTLSNEPFTLTLTDNANKFREPLAGNVILGGDFAGLSIGSILMDPGDNRTIKLTLSGDLAHHTGNGTITVRAAALENSFDLIANVKVAPPVATP